MERRDESSSPVTGNQGDDVITGGHQLVTCSGEGRDVGASASQCEDLLTCTLSFRSDNKLPGPIRSCGEGDREAGEDQGAGLTLKGDATVRTSPSVSTNCSSCTESEVISCYRADSKGSCGGGATGGTHLYLDENQEIVTSVTSDLQEVSSDDDEASAIPPQSRNTFQCGHRQSTLGQLGQEDAGSESELQSRRPGIVEYFSSRKQRSVSHSVAGWKLFGKVPPIQSPSRQARIIQQEFEARQVAVHSSPTHRTAGQRSCRGAEFEPLSTTALILEDRPANLPAKSALEIQRHREQYEQMVVGAKRKELKEAQRRQQQKGDRLRQEDQVSNNTTIWTHEILPQWDHMRWSQRAQDLWWAGLPPSIRGRVWSMTIGNELNITAELYEIFLCRAREKGRSLSDSESQEGASPSDRECSMELITRDVCRTFPSLCVFQKGGPYHGLLQSILGAYTCYRPDIGYVQGMSSMAALLVLNMVEVDAFVSFSNLMNRPCQLAFSRVDHQQMLRYFGAFQVFLEETLPRLFLHFQSLGVTPDLYLMDWILSLYTKPLPLDVACRVWDVFFRDGEEFLFRTALGILRMNQEVLLELDLISIAQFLSRLPDEELLSDRLFSSISATPMLSVNGKWSQVLSSCRDSERSS